MKHEGHGVIGIDDDPRLGDSRSTAVATRIALAGAALLMFLSGPDGVARANERSTAVISLHLQKGASFVSVRARLIESGWKPIRIHADDSDEYDGTEKRLADRKFLEVDSCSTDGGSLCIFYYAKDGTCLRVDTVGEQVDAMRVTRWDNACPNDPPRISDAGAQRAIQ
jgi:hypothetical protein